MALKKKLPSKSRKLYGAAKAARESKIEAFKERRRARVKDELKRRAEKRMAGKTAAETTTAGKTAAGKSPFQKYSEEYINKQVEKAIAEAKKKEKKRILKEIKEGKIPPELKESIEKGEITMPRKKSETETTTTTTTTTAESGTKKRSYNRRFKPTEVQIKKGSLAQLALAIPLGTIGAFGASALDGYVEVSGKGWKPPIIGWRGAAGLALMVGGAIARSPVFVGAGGVLFGSSIPGVVNAIGAATSSPALMAAADPMGLPYIRPKAMELDYDYDDDDFDEDELAEAAGEAIAARLEELGDGIE